jgi:hypothetical protein
MRHNYAMIVINDKDRAKEISTALTEAFDSIGRSLLIARDACDESQLKDYNRHVGDLFYIITFKLLEPIYQQHPELRPEDWDDKPPMDPA